MINRYTVYCASHDLTFIMEETENSLEVKGFVFGEVSAEEQDHIINEFYGRLKAEFDGGNGMNEFRQARLTAKLTQQEMSELMQIPKRTIEEWESGRRTPPPYVKRLVLNELKNLQKQGQKY